MLHQLVVPVGAAARALARGLLRVGMAPGCDLRVCRRLGTVGWGAHSPRYDDDDAAAVLGAIVDTIVVVVSIVVGNTATAAASADGVVVFVADAVVSVSRGRYHNCSTLDATTVALS